MARIKRKARILVAITVSSVALALSVANLILCFKYDIEKGLAIAIFICIFIVFLINLIYYIKIKRRQKREEEYG